MREFPAGIRTYKGSCRCGAIRFEADIDLGAGTTRCNCTICTKTGWWGCLVKPGDFRLLAGRESWRDLGSGPEAERPICRVCGIVPFGHGNLPELGGEYYSVNVRCLDEVDLSGVPVKYLDGRHDTWAVLAEALYVDPFAGAGGASTLLASAPTG
jgi:hypothetical protein